jgi:hypothetical protein
MKLLLPALLTSVIIAVAFIFILDNNTNSNLNIVAEDKLVADDTSTETNPNELKFGGTFTVVHFDKDGNELSREVIHNRVVDQGEDFIIDQSFKEGTAGETVDADQIASICVSAEAGFVATLETKTASGFDTSDGLATTNCISDSSVTQSSQTAVIGPETFTGGTHVPGGTIITGIGICQGSTSTPFANCADAQGASTGILFAQVDISDVTLATSETVQITYTFDISSSGT